MGVDIERDLTPMQIAEHGFLSQGEKIERLQELKAIATGAAENDRGYGFTPEEIDEAISHVRDRAKDGEVLDPIVSPRAAMR